MEEVYKSRLSIHPGAMKMHQDLRLSYWMQCMKWEVSWYVEWCLSYWLVKVGHQRPHGKLHPLKETKLKWEHITMNFITKFQCISNGFDSIWLIFDHLTKSAHFHAMRESSSAKKFSKVHMHEIVSWHCVPVSMVFDRDVQFTSLFWQSFHEELGTWLHFNTLITLRLMVKVSGPFTCLRIC